MSFEDEVDFEECRVNDMARGLKYGSYIADLEESVEDGDFKQLIQDVRSLRRYHDAVMAARRAKASE